MAVENGHTPEDRAELKTAFNLFKGVSSELKSVSLSDLKDRKALTALVGRLRKNAAADRRSA